MLVMQRRQFLQGVAATGTVSLAGVPRATAAGTAPGAPGSDSFWTTGEKYGVGTVADHGDSDASHVWFTLTEGALTEPRFPRVDLMCLRSVDVVVADGDGYVARTYNVDRTDDDTGADPVERRTERVEDDALLFRQTVSAVDRDWTVELEYAAAAENDAILADVSFESSAEYDVYLLVDAALSNSGVADTALVTDSDALAGFDTDDNDDEAVILDEDGDPYNVASAVVSDSGFDWTTVDFVGGDSLSPLLTDGDDATRYDRAEDGNVALVGRLGTGVDSLSETVALGFAEGGEEGVADAESVARASLARGYDAVRADYVASWRDYVPDPPAWLDADLASQYRAAAMELKAVDDKTFAGAGLASPSVPWGVAVNANEPRDYGYNYVWARDLYQVFTAYLAAGDVDSALEATEYIYEYQQDERGFIPQNTYIDGRTRWGGEQMDNISFPQVMAYQLAERHGIDFSAANYDYENVRRSANYVADNGPESAQERWEEESGYSPSTIAAEIAGLACAASLADDEGRAADALVWLALADDWTANVEAWTATETGTDEHTRTPYYFRVNDDRDPEDGADRGLANGGPTLDERNVVDAGFLELTRLGIKPWDDEVIRNSLAVVDDTIRVETPNGPGFYRYNGDGYGEQGPNDENYPRGAPWSLDNAGKGRLWPIFTGERAEYELLAGDEDPAALLDTMRGFANDADMIPEQVWDVPEPTDYNWEFGEGTGSATPLSWSMAQFVRLAHGVDAGEPVETPAFVRQRYVEGETPESPSLSASIPSTTDGETVRVEGDTDGATVVVRTPVESVVADGGSFAVDVAVDDGQNAVTVVAGSDADSLVDTGTAVVRETVTRVAVGDPVASFDDPEGDDDGPGGYVYPTNEAFVDGAFDLRRVELFETDDRYQFLVTLDELTDPFGGDAGFSLQTFHVYLRATGEGADGGSTETREGVDAALEAPHDARIVVEGFTGEFSPRVEAADGSVVTEDVDVVAYADADAVKFEVPKSAVGDLAEREFAPVVLGQDGFSVGRIRPVVAEAGGYVFGGGENDDSNPNVLDLLTPEGVSQSAALAYDDGPAEIPYVAVESGLVAERVAVEVESTVAPESRGVIPVSVESDATLDPETVRFGTSERVDDGEGAAPAHGGHEGGRYHFRTQETGVGAETETLVLVGETDDGTPVRGEATVRVVGGRGNGGRGNGGNDDSKGKPGGN